MMPWNRPPDNDDDDEVFILMIGICIFLVWVIAWGMTP